MDWLKRTFRKRKRESQLDSELRFHIELRTEELIAQGFDTTEAHRRAMVEFGGVEGVKEECREARAIYWLESLLADLRYAVRVLRKSPGFTIVAVLTLALGIGANTAIFSAVNGILLSPLLYPDSGHLIEIKGSMLMRGIGVRFAFLSIPDIREIQARCPAFGQVAMYGLFSGTKMLGGSFPDDVQTPPVSGNFFGLLGVDPILGRPILPSDAQSGAGPVAVLSYAVWMRDFGGDAKAIGKVITLGKESFEIVGVMPKGFNPGGYARPVWRPMPPPSGSGPSRKNFEYRAIARLRPGATLKAARVQLKVLAARLAKANPAEDKGLQLSATRMKDSMVGTQLRVELLLLLAAVGIVLLIACANVSALMLARSWSRQREVAIREALGATRLRIIRQFLIESLLASLAGGACGLLIAVGGIPLLRAIAPAGTPRVDQVHLDSGVLWFTLGASVLAGILFGLAPALQLSVGQTTTIRERVATSGNALGGKRTNRPQGALVISEVALAVILAAGATLLARSLQKLMAVPLGYRTEGVLTVQPDLSGSGCDSDRQGPCRAATNAILQGMRGIPGVEAAAVASTAPLGGGFLRPLEVEGRREPTKSGVMIPYRGVSSGYFQLMGIPLLAGRTFGDADTATSQPVAIVNRAFVRRYLQAASPLGRRISARKSETGQPEWMEIIGVVGDSRDSDITETPGPEYYVPAAQSSADVTAPVFLVKASESPLQILGAVKQQIWSVDKEAAIGRVQTMSTVVAREQAGQRFRALLFGTFAALGLLLAIVGNYGVISYSVNQRIHEIGIRMAMGAQPADVLRMVLRDGAILAGVGIVIGIGGALALTRLMRSFLFEISPTDPVTFAGVAITLALVALLACYIPARRAMRVDPNVALRHE